MIAYLLSAKFMVLTLMICLPNTQTFAFGGGGGSKEPTGFFTLDAADYGKDMSNSNVKYSSSHNKATSYNSEQTHMISIF